MHLHLSWQFFLSCTLLIFWTTVQQQFSSVSHPRRSWRVICTACEITKGCSIYSVTPLHYHLSRGVSTELQFSELVTTISVKFYILLFNTSFNTNLNYNSIHFVEYSKYVQTHRTETKKDAHIYDTLQLQNQKSRAHWSNGFLSYFYLNLHIRTHNTYC